MSASTPSQRADWAAYSRRRYERFKELGLCAMCGQVEPPQGMVTCRDCLPANKGKVSRRAQPLSPIAVARWQGEAMQTAVQRSGRQTFDPAVLVEGLVMYLDNVLTNLEEWNADVARKWRAEAIRQLENPP